MRLFLKYTFFSIAILLGACAPERPIPKELGLSGMCQSSAPSASAGHLAEQSVASTVRLKVVKKGPGCGFFSVGAGTGVVIDQKRGLILTAAHVVARGVKLEATTLILKDGGIEEGQTVEVIPLAVDYGQDAAVLMVRRQNSVPPAVPLRCDWPVHTGDFIYHFGQTSGISYGKVSGVHIHVNLKRNRPVTVIETTAQAQPGDSGGPVLDSEGRLIGIVVMRNVRSGSMLFVHLKDVVEALDGPVRLPR